MCRQLQASDACRTQDVTELLREERVSVVDQEPLAGQEPSMLSLRLRAICSIHAQ